MMQEWLKAEILDGVNIFYTGACQILRILPEQNTSTFCISVSVLIEDLTSQLLSMILGLDNLDPDQ